jgi:hypothetical protein
VRTAGGIGAGSTLSREDTPKLHGAVAIVRVGLAAEPPAHSRLASGHDPCGKAACSNFIASNDAARHVEEGIGTAVIAVASRLRSRGSSAPLMSRHIS